MNDWIPAPLRTAAAIVILFLYTLPNCNTIFVSVFFSSVSNTWLTVDNRSQFVWHSTQRNSFLFSVTLELWLLPIDMPQNHFGNCLKLLSFCRTALHLSSMLFQLRFKWVELTAILFRPLSFHNMIFIGYLVAITCLNTKYSPIRLFAQWDHSSLINRHRLLFLSWAKVAERNILLYFVLFELFYRVVNHGL